MSADHHIVQDILSRGPFSIQPAPPLPAGKKISHDPPLITLPEIPDDSIEVGPGDIITFPREDLEDAAAGPQTMPPPNSLDAWAWYAPFHFYRADAWGIYIRESGLFELASRLVRRAQGTVSTKKLEHVAYYLLLDHELFHHTVEVACTRLQYPLLAAGGAPLYPSYFNCGYASVHEEMLANANAVRRIGGAGLSCPLRSAAIAELVSHPRPYCDFQAYLADRKYVSGKRVLLARMLDAAGLRHLPLYHNARELPLRQSAYFPSLTWENSLCPVRIVPDLGKMRLN